ncbi:MAG: hypothetical protein ACKV0T_27150, partial [Planctomycetales bacterium]
MMTRTEDNSEPTDERRWACELFGIPAHAAPADRVRLVLRQLESADFVPPAAWQDAVEILSRPAPEEESSSPTGSRAFQQDYEDRLREEIDTLASRFFLTPPAQRQQSWIDLCDQCRRSLPLTERLARLEPGLAIESPEFTVVAPHSDELAGWILRLFPLSPEARAIQFCVALDQAAVDAGAWVHAAAWLQKEQPEIARLGVDLIDAILFLEK